MNEKILAIKEWLGTGSINIFGLPMSGKDTVGLRLAEDLGAKLLSSGMMIRQAESESKRDLTSSGELAPTEDFYNIVLPIFEREDLKPYGLILSSVGRWAGEEDAVMAAAEAGGHPIKAAVVLNISEADVMERWRTAKTLGDRGVRADDMKEEAFRTRLQEFREKTMPVLVHYQQLGLLVPVTGDLTRDEVYALTLDGLYQFAMAHRASAA